MTTLADQLAQALALVSTGALDEDYSKIATAAAVAEQPSETPSPSSLRRAGLLGCGGFASVCAKVLEELPFDVKRGAAFAKFGPVATLDLDGGQDEFDVDATPATPDVVANTSPELF